MFFKELREESKEYGIPIWKMPDFILIFMALTNIFVMVGTYMWAKELVDDPRKAVFLVAIESVLILVIGNIIIETSKKMVRISKIRKEFIQVVSHQMRTPVTTIKWSLEMIKRDNHNLSDKQIEQLHKIEEEEEKIRMMLNDILNVSKFERDYNNGEQKSINISKVLKEFIATSNNYAKLKGVEIKEDIPKEESFVLGDEDKLRLVVTNLIENAINYSHKGGQVKVAIREKGRRVLISIKDQGIGVGAKDQEHIFDKFYRGKNGRKKEPQGTGLGLYISKMATEQMGGKIKLWSQPGKGTKLTVILKKTKEM